MEDNDAHVKQLVVPCLRRPYACGTTKEVSTRPTGDARITWSETGMNVRLYSLTRRSTRTRPSPGTRTPRSVPLGAAFLASRRRTQPHSRKAGDPRGSPAFRISVGLREWAFSRDSSGA